MDGGAHCDDACLSRYDDWLCICLWHHRYELKFPAMTSPNFDTGLLLATLPGHIHAVVGVGALILLGPLILVVIFLGAQLGMWQAVHGWFDD